MSIDKYDVLRYAETLSEEDLQLLLEQLILIKNVKHPLVLSETVKVDTDLIKKQIRNIPPYKPEPLRSVSDGFISKVPEHEKHTSKKSIEDRMKDFKDFLEKADDVLLEKGVLVTPPFVSHPPKIVWKDCICSSWWKVVHPKDCKCGGGRFVPEGEL